MKTAIKNFNIYITPPKFPAGSWDERNWKPPKVIADNAEDVFNKILLNRKISDSFTLQKRECAIHTLGEAIRFNIPRNKMMVSAKKILQSFKNSFQK